jgi:hypothetical protein
MEDLGRSMSLVPTEMGTRAKGMKGNGTITTMVIMISSA